MCGVSVIYKFNNEPVLPSDLVSMASSVSHRGPDEAGIAVLEGGQVGLAHVRLSIMDIASGQQPMFNSDQSISITYNGEIYDLARFRIELSSRGYRFRTRSDTEVILYLYEEYGLDFLQKINGEFAFAIWDGRSKSLVVARDRSGIKPLYYHINSNEMILCSEVKGIFCLQGITREFSKDYLLSTPFAFEITGGSPYKDILSVRPGHCLVVNSQGVQEFAYWQPEYETDENIDFGEAKDQLRGLFEKAVTRRMVADVPVGAYLSGGIDSTLTCAMIAKNAGSFKAFNLSFIDTQYDESSMARRIADYYGADFHSLPCSMDMLADAFEKTLYHTEMIIANPGHIGKQLLSAYARSNDVKVCQTGEGADELFAGYAFFKQEKLWRMLQSGGKQAVEARVLMKTFEQEESRSQGLSWNKSESWRSGEYIFGYPNFRQSVVALLSKMVAPNLFNREALGLSSEDTPMNLLASSFPLTKMRDLHPLNASRLMALSSLSEYILPVLGDRSEMANSLECRTPFLDKELLEFSSKLPPRYLVDIKSLREKYIVHEAFKNDLPPFIYGQRKHPFSADGWGHFVRTRLGGELFQYHLAPSRIKETGIFNSKYISSVKAMWEKLPQSSALSRKLCSTLGVVLCVQALHDLLIVGSVGSHHEINIVDRTPLAA